jgi:hypothetical protein
MLDGESYHLSRGTFMNKVSVLMKRGKVEWLCDSPQGFYILKELGQYTNTITNDDHTGVNRLTRASSCHRELVLTEGTMAQVDWYIE